MTVSHILFVRGGECLINNYSFKEQSLIKIIYNISYKIFLSNTNNLLTIVYFKYSYQLYGFKEVLLFNNNHLFAHSYMVLSNWS